MSTRRGRAPRSTLTVLSPETPQDSVKQALAHSYGYPFALAVTIVPVLLVVAVLAAVGHEAPGVRFGAQQDAKVPATVPTSSAV